MFKFLDFLFEKEDEEIVESKAESIEVSNEVVVPTKAVNEVKVEEAPLNIPMEDEKQTWSDVDHILEEIQEKPTQIKKVKTQSQPYVFTESISPIFGMKEKKGKETKVASGQKVVTHHANPSKIGTVLSPIYGVDVLDEEEVEMIADSLTCETIENQDVKVNSQITGFVQESLFSTKEDEEKECIANETLASLIQNNEIETSKKVLDFNEDESI